MWKAHHSQICASVRKTTRSFNSAQNPLRIWSKYYDEGCLMCWWAKTYATKGRIRMRRQHCSHFACLQWGVPAPPCVCQTGWRWPQSLGMKTHFPPGQGTATPVDIQCCKIHNQCSSSTLHWAVLNDTATKKSFICPCSTWHMDILQDRPVYGYAILLCDRASESLNSFLLFNTNSLKYHFPCNCSFFMPDA